MKINHRYHILEKLGEGGSGEVFLVEDTLKQRQRSAMKILRGDGQPDRIADEQFRNEVSILAAFHHLNLVRVFDFGTVQSCDDSSLRGRRFFTMEYVKGLTALQKFQSLRTDQERARHLKHIVLQVCAVLSHLHRRGIIHFDIKPENLLLIEGGEKEDELPLLKLADFGFSAKQDATLEFSLRGTLEYTAPELLRRESYDHRVDLYSLGATIYHLVEGHCPFEAGGPVELIKKVLTAKPEFRRSAEPAYAAFGSLLAGLLQKDPKHRLQSPRESVRVLLAGEEHTATTVFDQPLKPSFVGREKEKEHIGLAISSLGQDQPGNIHVAVLISGPEGIGKSALLTEMIRIARASDVPVLEMDTSQRDVPFGAILSLLSLLQAEMLSRSTGGVQLAERFADVLDWPQPTDGNTNELQTEWVRERDKTIEAQARFINQASLLFPFIVAVDDAEHMDPESREVLRVAARDGRRGRVLFLLAARSESSLPVAAHRVPLGELDSQSVRAMSISVLSPVIVGEAIGNRLYQLYGGTPALVVEALLSASTLLREDVSVDAPGIAALVKNVIGKLPRDLDEFLLVRYKSLDRGLQLVLDILSCFIAPARLEAIQASLPFQQQRTANYLSSLEGAGFVTSSYDGVQRFSLRHIRLKSRIYSTIVGSRQDIHMFIASTLEGSAWVRSFSDLQELAYQFKAGGRYAESMRWLEAAADEGMRLASYQRSKDLYQEAVNLGTGSDAMHLAQLNCKLAQSLFTCGEFREAVALAHSMLATNHPDDIQKAGLHKTAGLAQSRLGEYEEAKRHLDAALAFSSENREKMELTQEMVGIEIALGNFAEAESTCIGQLDRARHLSDPRLTASVYTDLGIATFFQDLFDRSAGYFQEAMKIYAGLKQHARVADAMMNIGNVMSARGNIVKALESWTEALKTSQEYGTLNQQALIQNNLGIAHYKLKRFKEARDLYNNAKEIFSRLGSKQGSAYVLTNLGEVGLAEGQYEHALELWEDAQSLYREMNDAQGIAETTLQLAQVHFVLGAIESVASNLDEAEAIVNEKSLEAFRSQLLNLRGMLMMCLNECEAARLYFTHSEQSAHDSEESERRLLIRVRKAECENRLGRHDSAVTIAYEAMKCGEKVLHPQVVAEACFQLGMIARSSPSKVPDKALPLFRKGLDAIAKEPVTEMTWNLAFALGLEFRERGQRDKARESFAKARLVLQFFLAQFTSSELKNSYLMAGSKEGVLAALDSYLKT